MKKYLPLLIVFGLLLASCGPTPGPASPTPDLVSTVVAATMQAVPTAGEPLREGEFRYQNVSFFIPRGFASGATGETVERVEATADGPVIDVAPEHIRITLNDYMTGPRRVTPQIFVFPADEYASMNDAAAIAMNDLRSLLSGSSDLPAKLPHLPAFNAQQMFTAKSQLVPFGSGRGVRYITQYANGIVPVTNDEIFYTFQGFTKDGKYYVSVQVPITAAILDTMPTPDLGANFNPEEWPKYVEGMATTINSFGNPFFTPVIDDLDRFILTITVSS